MIHRNEGGAVLSARAVFGNSGRLVQLFPECLTGFQKRVQRAGAACIGCDRSTKNNQIMLTNPSRHTPEDGSHFKHAVKVSANAHLLVQLRRLGQAGLGAHVVHPEDGHKRRISFRGKPSAKIWPAWYKKKQVADWELRARAKR